MCDTMFLLDILSFNVYKIKNKFYCGKDYIEIQQQHMKRGVKWFGDLYWEKLKSRSEMKKELY